MGRMIGIILIIIGLLTATSGLILIIESSKAQVVLPYHKVESTAAADRFNQVASSDSTFVTESSATQIEIPPLKAESTVPANNVVTGHISDQVSGNDEININVKAGLDFEKYVVLKFNDRYFTLKNWTSDKYVAGRYAETNTHPDLQLELKLRGKVYPLAVECKWRSKAKADFVRFADDDQLKHYKAFEEKNRIPTFIVLGVGGAPSAPEIVYVIPVKHLTKPIQHLDSLKQYQRLQEKNFYFDLETEMLK